MIAIQNTNITLNSGTVILRFGSDNTARMRTVLTRDGKKTLKKYFKAGYKLFDRPVLYRDDRFYRLNRKLEICTRNNDHIVVNSKTEVFLLDRAVDCGTLSLD